MTFLIPWALAGLTVLVPLCLVQLRHPPRREVASTLLWRDLGTAAVPWARRVARRAVPLLMALQVAGVIFCVGALAEPVTGRAAIPPVPPPIALGGADRDAGDSAGALPPLPRHATVTVVGSGATAADLARGFGATTGVTARVLPPSGYLTSRSADAGLLVLDHWLPPGGLPVGRGGVFLVDPPPVPSSGSASVASAASPAVRAAGGFLSDPVLSGLDDTSPLLAGVDLTSLSVPVSATERFAGPGWLAPVAWTPSGPLLAAGADGGRRVAALAFNPALTNLPQLSAFPILLQNILRWCAVTSARDVPAVRARGTAARSWRSGGTRTGPTAPPTWWRLAVIAALLTFTAEAVFLARLARRSGSWGPNQRRGLLARAAAIGLLGGALAGPALTEAGGGAPLLLVDRSGSVAGPVLAAENAWTRAIRRAAPQARVVTFGASAGTGIAAAVQAAEGIVTAGSASRVVLLSDGLATAGDAVAAALAARYPVDVADVAAGVVNPDAAVTRLAVPTAVRAGDAITLQVTVRATVARAATVAVWRDGRVVSRLAVRLAAGDNPLLASSPSGAPGWRRFRVTVSMAGDRVPGNDALDAVTRVAARPRLLYVGSPDARSPGPGRGPSPGGTVPRLLRRLGFTVSVRPPSALPRQVPGYRGIDGVIADDVPNGSVVPAQLTALAAAVRRDGLGLLVLGGTRSLDAGWYAGSPLAAALPVTGTGSGPRDATLELVLDRSGSMNDLAGADTKISMAQAAAAGAIAFARAHRDRLGIVSFDTVPRVIVPLQVMSPAAAAAADRAVARLSASGGTDIYAALRAAAGQLGVGSRATTATGVRQVILMTDGVSQSASYDALVHRLRASGVSLSAIGLGGQVDQALLRHLAGLGGGRYYYTNDAAALPRIFAAEERRSVRPDHVTGRMPAWITASVPAVRSLVGDRLPDVSGLDATALKPLATGVITTGTVATVGSGATGAGTGTARGGAMRYPVLAQWQYGLGRVAVWTPGLDSGWAANWTGETGLWNDTVRWLLPGVPVPVLEPWLRDAHPGGAASVVVDTLANAGVTVRAAALLATVTPPHGPAARVTLGAAGAGLFTGTLPAAGPGVYRIALRPAEGAGTASVAAELAVGYPREYLPGPAGPALLAEVAAGSGGRVLTSPASGAAWESAHNGTRRLGLWWLLTAAGLLVFSGGVLLRPPPLARRFPSALTTQEDFPSVLTTREDSHRL